MEVIVIPTYPNLEREMKRRGITNRALAAVAEICYKSMYNKLTGKAPFTWPEICKIRMAYFPDMTSDELFAAHR